MKVLLTGAKGYIGFPLFLQLNRKYDVVGVDNESRSHWVSKITGVHSAPPHLDGNIYGDLSDPHFVAEIIQIHKPDVVIHLASQPSMPYSDMSLDRALFTQVNNVSMNLNLLWAIKQFCPKARYIITTTTGIPGQAYNVIPEMPVNNMAGSWYHITRGFDSENCGLASRQFGINVVEFRTAIVYGMMTDGLRDSGFDTRFDTDFYFGTALNRFIDQAIKGTPITVYGKGEQTKPFIDLADCCDSIENAIEYGFNFDDKKHHILNQITECVSINTIANILNKETGVEIRHIDNPRKENEEFRMYFDTTNFLRVLNKKPRYIENGMREMILQRKQMLKLK